MRVIECQAQRNTRDRTLLASVAVLRAAVEGGGPYKDELQAVETLGHGDAKITDALRPLEAASASGIPGPALLAERFRDETAPAILAAASPKPQAGETANPNLVSRILDRMRGLVSIRRLGTSGNPAAVPVEAARKALAAGDLAAAVKALSPLEGAAADAARPFIAAVQLRLDSERALASVSREIMGRLAEAAAAPEDHR